MVLIKKNFYYARPLNVLTKLFIVKMFIKTKLLSRFKGNPSN